MTIWSQSLLEHNMILTLPFPRTEVNHYKQGHVTAISDSAQGLHMLQVQLPYPQMTFPITQKVSLQGGVRNLRKGKQKFFSCQPLPFQEEEANHINHMNSAQVLQSDTSANTVPH